VGAAFLGLLCAVTSSGWGQRSASGASPLLPNASLTPGGVLAVTKADVCQSGYSKLVRNVPQAVKDQAYKNYGITHHAAGEYEVDHLISLELGGSNSIKNLWPQSYLTQPWNAHVKDKLENELHRLMCNGTISMATAQHDISTDWIAAYKKYFHTTLPLAKRNTSNRNNASIKGTVIPRNGSARPSLLSNLFARKSAKVWVNLSSGLYFQPGTRYYGKTQKGVYMSETNAKKKGYKAAKEH
jgi:hypothetical protein